MCCAIKSMQQESSSCYCWKPWISGNIKEGIYSVFLQKTVQQVRHPPSQQTPAPSAERHSAETSSQRAEPASKGTEDNKQSMNMDLYSFTGSNNRLHCDD